MKHEESNIQIVCVNWFRLMHPNLVLSSSLNGVKLSGTQIQRRVKWNRLVQEGAKAGVADLFLMHASNGFHGLYIEIKTPKGKQSPEQKAFEHSALIEGYEYKIARSLDEFILIIKNYLKS